MHATATLLDWLIPQAQGIGDFVYFKLINEYFNHKIDKFGLQLMGRAMIWASSIGLTLVTLWILIAGYRIATGQSRDSMISLATNAARIAFIVGLASSMSFAGGNLHRFLSVDLDEEIHALFTGKKGDSADAIDRNLAYMQIAMSAIDLVQVPANNPELQAKKEKAMLFAGVGTASPPMVAGAMLLLYKFTLALFIGLGPIFILCLIFDQTKELFRKWLMYGLGIAFSMSMLSVVTAMVLELMTKIAMILWASKITGILGSATEGLTTQAMQQGGIGLLMSAVIVSVPPAAAMFFQGTLGSFNYSSAFSNASKDKSTDAYARQQTAKAPENNPKQEGSFTPPLPQMYRPNQTGSSDVMKSFADTRREER